MNTPDRHDRQRSQTDSEPRTRAEPGTPPVLGETAARQALAKRLGRPRGPEQAAYTAQAVGAVAWLHERFGRPPKRKEIGEALGVTSIASVVERLERLQRLGFIVYVKGEMMSLHVTEAGRAFLEEWERQHVAKLPQAPQQP